MATRQSTLRAIDKYQKEKVPRLVAKFYPKDHDLYDWCKQQESSNGYMMRLIREDMERAIAAGEYEAQRVTTGRGQTEEEDADGTGKTA